MSARHDVLIVGGGLVGVTLALSLADSGWDVALVEAGVPGEAPAPGGDYDLRVSAVSPASQQWLMETDVWPALDKRRVCAYETMHVWTSKPPGSLTFRASELGLPALGYIVENRLLLAAAWARRERITLYCPARLSALAFDSQAARALLADGREIRTALVVGADGAHSPTRRLAGLSGGGWEYGQRGLVSVITTAEGHRHTAWQRFLPGGPLALLPLANGQTSIVWSVPDNEARRLENLPASEFCARVSDASGGVLGEVVAARPRASFPLTLRHVPDYVAPRLALVGDAAHVVHPLAGQGANLGFMDGAALAAELGRAGGEAGDPGALRRLRRYARLRKNDNLAMLAATDGLHRLFTSGNPLARLTRGPGLSLVDALGPVKKILIKQAVGL